MVTRHVVFDRYSSFDCNIQAIDRTVSLLLRYQRLNDRMQDIETQLQLAGGPPASVSCDVQGAGVPHWMVNPAPDTKQFGGCL